MTAIATSVRSSSRSRFIWPASFFSIVVLLFIFYKDVMPGLQDNISSGVNDWLPLSSINESMVWVIMALGLNVVVGYAGLLDLGYVAFWAVGGYAAGWLMSQPWAGTFSFHFAAPPSVQDAQGIHVTFWLVLIVAGVGCVIAGLIIGAPTLRLRGDYLALVTLGFGEMTSQVARNGSVFGVNVTNGDNGIPAIDPIGTGPLAAIPGVPKELDAFADSYKLLVLAALVGLCLFVSLRIRDGRLGRAWLAIREDELAASMMGVPVMKVKLSAYAVGAFFGGLGGVGFASAVTGNVAASRFDFAVSITVLLMVVLGGMGNVWGVTIGAILLSWINSTGLNQIGVEFDSVTGLNVGDRFKQNQYLLFGVVLVLMMLFRPGGLIPEKRTSKLMKEPSRTEAESLGADITEAEVESETEAAGRPS